MFVSNGRWAFKRPFISPVGGRLKYFNQQPKLNPKARLSKVQKCFLIRLFWLFSSCVQRRLLAMGRGPLKTFHECQSEEPSQSGAFTVCSFSSTSESELKIFIKSFFPVQVSFEDFLPVCGDVC